jgi:hypothetical protein
MIFEVGGCAFRLRSSSVINNGGNRFLGSGGVDEAAPPLSKGKGPWLAWLAHSPKTKVRVTSLVRASQRQFVTFRIIHDSA